MMGAATILSKFIPLLQKLLRKVWHNCHGEVKLLLELWMGLRTSFHRLSQMVWLGLAFTVVWLGLDLIGFCNNILCCAWTSGMSSCFYAANKAHLIMLVPCLFALTLKLFSKPFSKEWYWFENVPLVTRVLKTCVHASIIFKKIYKYSV